jgi:hypothetical protein
MKFFTSSSDTTIKLPEYYYVKLNHLLPGDTELSNFKKLIYLNVLKKLWILNI